MPRAPGAERPDHRCNLRACSRGARGAKSFGKFNVRSNADLTRHFVNTQLDVGGTRARHVRLWNAEGTPRQFDGVTRALKSLTLFFLLVVNADSQQNGASERTNWTRTASV